MMTLRGLIWLHVACVAFAVLACRNLIPLMHYDYTNTPDPWAGPIILATWFASMIVIPVMVLRNLNYAHWPFPKAYLIALLEFGLIGTTVMAMLPAVD